MAESTVFRAPQRVTIAIVALTAGALIALLL
jgi:hypothetical protein